MVSTPEELKERRRLRDKDYRIRKAEEIKIKMKIYQEKNRRRILEYKKQYHIENRNKILDKCRKYQEENKDNCICGRIVSHYNMGRHLRSNVHFNNLIQIHEQKKNIV